MRKFVYSNKFHTCESKSLLSIVTYSGKTEDPSILDVAKKVHSLLVCLANFDAIFEHPHYFKGNREASIQIHDPLCAEHIAELILNSERYEITKYEGVNKPTIHYKRKGSGFSFNSKFIGSDGKGFAFNYGAGYMNDGVSVYSFNREHQYDYAWYEQLARQIVRHTEAYYGVVKVSTQVWDMFYKDLSVRLPLGWMTFYSNYCGYHIPDDLDGIRYEYNNEGKFLFASEEDFLKDKSSYFGFMAKIGRIMKVLIERVPELRLDENN